MDIYINAGKFVSAVLVTGVCKTSPKSNGTATLRTENWRDYMKWAKRIILIAASCKKIGGILVELRRVGML